MTTTGTYVPALRGLMGGMHELSCRYHDYKGVRGAQQILARLTAETHVLDMCYQKLGVDGLTTLLDGLEAFGEQVMLDRSDRAPKGYEWALRGVSAVGSELGDAGLMLLMAYAAEWNGLESLDFTLNNVELSTYSDKIVSYLNLSCLSHLDLSGNPLLGPTATYFFDKVDAPNLISLCMDDCNLRPDAADAIADYICCSRSRNLLQLELNGNQFDLATIRFIYDCAEEGNFTLQRLGLQPASWPEGSIPEDHAGAVDADDPDVLVQLERMPGLAERNAELGMRVQRAALNSLSYARILLNAQSPLPPYSSRPPSPSQPTSILDLPVELLHSIIRFSSGDAGALSDAQWAWLMVDAEGKEHLGSAVAARKAVPRLRREHPVFQKEAEASLAHVWLQRGMLVSWERNM